MQLGELAGALAHSYGEAHETAGDRPFKCLRLTIGDIECRRHFVAILHPEATGREADASHHVGVDDTQTLLLAGGYELRAVDFHAVDIHGILVVCASTH